jgi:hypothetical protein
MAQSNYYDNNNINNNNNNNNISNNNTGTTSINNLPNGITNNNAQFSANNISNESVVTPTLGNPTQNNTLDIDQQTLTQLVSDVQHAEHDGLTQLQSRDIPQDTTQFTQDVQIKPNYIPAPKQTNDYIKEEMEADLNNENEKAKINYSNSIFGEKGQNIYAELQTPLLLSILFFIFQMPFFKNKIMEFFPFLFINDGNYSINGYILISILFGVVYYSLNTLISNIVPTIEH